MSEELINKTILELAPQMQRTYRHRWPYYKERYAEAVRKLLDKLFADPSKEFLRIPAVGMAVETLRQQFFQGAAYLVDNMDPDGLYARMQKETRCRAYKRDGFIELNRRITIEDQVAQDTVAVIPWKAQILEFLEIAEPGNKFRKALKLDDSDQMWIRSNLEPFGAEFIWQVTNREVIIIKDKV